MLNRPSATHPSQIFLHFHSISLRWPIYIINSLDKNKLSSLEAFVQALTFWNGLGRDFLRDSSKPFRWFSDSFTQVTKGNTAEKFVKTTAILRFGSTQSRRIPAVTHIKILSAEHAQTKCLYACSGRTRYCRAPPLAELWINIKHRPSQFDPNFWHV